VKYLQNKGNLYYRIKSYSKKRNVMTLEDPHTEESFKLYNARETIKLAGYKVVSYDE
jgi:hypothetical protein